MDFDVETNEDDVITVLVKEQPPLPAAIVAPIPSTPTRIATAPEEKSSPATASILFIRCSSENGYTSCSSSIRSVPATSGYVWECNFCWSFLLNSLAQLQAQQG
ncbi:hypothetical protein CAEBREN_02270 [Caenorhabditis brenneri]|uniref:Uncharacterized protein n=1 Tax=Caenorhabditis brenneri TaxID=135651 RepID=G0NW84_CAEBE|nr:hypothetical protein CAEBREN_02270 [Caenorhabditis brenneri]